MKVLSIYICLFLLCISCSNDDDGRELSDLNDITSFSINEQQTTINNNMITLELATGTDITALTPVIEHTGASIAPENGSVQNFTNPVVYTITAENGNTQEFTVTVTVVLAEENKIISFSINEQQSTIDNNKITLELDTGTDITALTPVIEHTGISIAPENGTAQDFTDPVVYTVTAENGNTQEFTVTITVTLAQGNEIISFSINEQQATIDNNKITLELDTGTDITALTPVIEHTGISIAPENGSVHDFTNPVVYTVTAENGNTQEFTVTLTVVEPSDLNDITSFSINQQQGTIDNNMITLELDTGTDITALTPIIEHTGVSIAPESGSAQDFTNPVVYTVVAENGNTQEFTVTVSVGLGTASGIEFITTWSAGEITIPTNSDFTYNYNVDWDNDGVIDESGITGDITHTFDTNEEHTIRITGTFPSIQFGGNSVNGEDQADKIISVDQWGTRAWLSMANSFEFCENLEILATDIPDLSSVTDLSSMFADAFIVNFDVSNWDTSNITDMNFMFIGTKLINPDVSDWDTGNVTNITAMFLEAKSANPDISNWNISKVTRASDVFDKSAFSTENYDKLLISFANQTRQNDVRFGGDITTFCSDEAAAARATLIDESNWSIDDAGRDVQCQ